MPERPWFVPFLLSFLFPESSLSPTLETLLRDGSPHTLELSPVGTLSALKGGLDLPLTEV